MSDELLNLQKKLARLKLLIVDELGWSRPVKWSPRPGAIVLLLFSRLSASARSAYGRASLKVRMAGPEVSTTNLTHSTSCSAEVFGNERGCTGRPAREDASLTSVRRRIILVEMNLCELLDQSFFKWARGRQATAMHVRSGDPLTRREATSAALDRPAETVSLSSWACTSPGEGCWYMVWTILATQGWATPGYPSEHFGHEVGAAPCVSWLSRLECGDGAAESLISVRYHHAPPH